MGELSKMSKRIPSPDSNSSLIGIYEDALTVNECESLMSKFEESEQSPGQTLGGYTPEWKKCMEISSEDMKFSQTNIVSTTILKSLKECIGKYKMEYPALSVISRWGVVDQFTFQKYETEDDGYKSWHCEHGSHPESAVRILAWMFYLNNAKSGTEFKHYPTVNAKMGRCVIWPAAWTHLHKGVTPNEGLKYIITGWFSHF